ncbi:hypothetical protein DFP72DRAFT_225519 [Ephemerocybe angulata]|uniref:Uncharacterized protein n=1 Tax=Ephemerocybe angulata TaxID=980116 RepID=A0A8H6LUU1_9AGAR|nr:hypothetical protein DFP72DRAFT_225519 [Tulosesus angulatus]
MPAVEFSLDEAGNPILPSTTPAFRPNDSVAGFKIVPSHEDLSLHPRVLWNQCKKYMLWDHRTYYGLLELLAGSVIVLSIVGMNEGRDTENMIQKAGQGLFILAGIIPIHWYSNQRLSIHILTQARSHIAILALLTLVTFVLQIVTLFTSECEKAGYGFCESEVSSNIQILLWLTIPIFVWTAIVIWKVTHSRPITAQDPSLAELPSMTRDDGDRVDDEATLAWASANVADGIEDDSLEPLGQVRL